MKHNIAERTVITEVTVQDAPDMVTDYGRYPYQPDTIRVTTRNGQISQIETQGPARLKSGALSGKLGRSDSFTPYRAGLRGVFGSLVPEWVMEIAREVTR